MAEDDWGDAIEPGRFDDNENRNVRGDWMGDTQTRETNAQLTGTDQILPGELGRAQQAEEARKSVEARFFSTVSAIAQLYSANDNGATQALPLTQADILTMTSANLFGKKKYLNPTAYVLGYYASQGGRDMSPVNVRERLARITKNIFPHQPPEVGVTEADVIRYARFWQLLAR